MSDDPPNPQHDHVTIEFPKDFLWGAATSAHQVEGNNILNDWWEWEQRVQPFDLHSGQTADQYNRYEEDFTLAKELDHKAHRLSIEWSRIEPEEGKFSEQAIEHYKKVLKSLKDKGFTVMLTLHHFTNPLWLSKIGGWENLKTPFYFERFVKKIVPEIKEYVDLWITINEPGVYTYMSYMQGQWPPQKKSYFSGAMAAWNMARAHKRAYRAIKNLSPTKQVGIANVVLSFDNYHHHSLKESIAVLLMDWIGNHWFYRLTGIKYHDFLGLNYYMNYYLSFNGEKTRLPSLIDINTTKKDVSDMGWEIYPEGIFDVLMDFSDYHKPIYITENGLASTNDDRRVRFLLSYLKEIYHAIQAGVNVRGYFYWSLIDNFEWAWGFTPRFGLIGIDYKTQKRTPRPSAYVYQAIIQKNGIPHRLLRLLGHTVRVEEVIGIK